MKLASFQWRTDTSSFVAVSTALVTSPIMSAIIAISNQKIQPGGRFNNIYVADFEAIPNKGA